MIALRTELTQLDYDRALIGAAAPQRWAVFAVQAVIAVGCLAMISQSGGALIIAMARAWSDPQKWARIQSSGNSWALVVGPVGLAFGTWFLWTVGRSTLAGLRQALRPRDRRALLAGVHLGPVTYAIMEAGLLIRTRDTRRFMPWTAFSRAVEEPGRIRLQFRRESGGAFQLGAFIPSRLLPNEAARADFVAALNKHLEAAST